MLTWLVPFEKFALINMHFSALELSGKLLTVTCIFASFLAVDLEGRVDRRCLQDVASELLELSLNQGFRDMHAVGALSNDACAIIGVGTCSEQYSRLIRFGAGEVLLQLFRASADTHDKYTCS